MKDKGLHPRLALHVFESTEHQMFRLRARPVTLGPTRDYPNLRPEQIRNASDENPQVYRGLYLKDLEAMAYGHEPYATDSERQRSISFYGALAYRDLFSVERREAVKMANTLRLIEKRLAKLREGTGHPESFGMYLAQLGRALKADAMVFNSGREPRSGWVDYDDREHLITNLGDGVSQVNYLVRQWIDTGRALKDKEVSHV